MYEAAATCKDIARAPVTNLEPQCVTLAGYCYAVRHGMKFQLVTPYRVSHMQCYGVTARGKVTSVPTFSVSASLFVCVFVGVCWLSVSMCDYLCLCVHVVLSTAT